MKNKEKYLEEILEYFNGNNVCNFKLKYIHKKSCCSNIECPDCKTKTKELLEQEYEEPIILTRNEKAILESLGLGSMFKYVARDKDGCLCIYKEKPMKKDSDMYGGYWYKGGFECPMTLFKHLFQFIKWEDSEPYNIKELLGKCEVIEND